MLVRRRNPDNFGRAFCLTIARAKHNVISNAWRWFGGQPIFMCDHVWWNQNAKSRVANISPDQWEGSHAIWGPWPTIHTNTTLRCNHIDIMTCHYVFVAVAKSSHIHMQSRPRCEKNFVWKCRGGSLRGSPHQIHLKNTVWTTMGSASEHKRRCAYNCCSLIPKPKESSHDFNFLNQNMSRKAMSTTQCNCESWMMNLKNNEHMWQQKASRIDFPQDVTKLIHNKGLVEIWGLIAFCSLETACTLMSSNILMFRVLWGQSGYTLQQFFLHLWLCFRCCVQNMIPFFV